MARWNVSSLCPLTDTFRKLIISLQEQGFDVDHFHAVEFFPIDPDQLVHRMGDNTSVQQIYFRVQEGRVILLEDHVSHLNLSWDECGNVVEAVWDTGDGHNALDDDPRPWEKLVADEWHER